MISFVGKALMQLESLYARVRSLVKGIRNGARLDAEMSAEFRAHIDLRAADLERRGIPAAEARRLACLEFGSTHVYTERGRLSRGLRTFDALHISWLDVKIAYRLLGRYPGLTIV